MNEDEYLKGGMVYCKKCNGRRGFFYDGRLLPCLCECQSAEFERTEREQKFQEQKRQLSYSQQGALMGERYYNASFGATEMIGGNFEEVFKRCRKYCEVASLVLAKGQGIYLFGKNGTGKTHLTACMANDLMMQGYSVLFTNGDDIAKAIKETYRKSYVTENEIVNRFARIDFLFFDDLGTERLKKENEDTFLQEKIYDVLNKRYNNMRPTVFTANYSMQELVEKRGMLSKTVDRIMEMSTAVLKLECENYRRKKHLNDVAEF